MVHISSALYSKLALCDDPKSHFAFSILIVFQTCMTVELNKRCLFVCKNYVVALSHIMKSYSALLTFKLLNHIQTCVKFDDSDAKPHWVVRVSNQRHCAKFVYAEAKIPFGHSMLSLYWKEQRQHFPRHLLFCFFTHAHTHTQKKSYRFGNGMRLSK